MENLNDPREIHMLKAIELAKNAVSNGEAPFGAVIVDTTNDQVITQGANHAKLNSIWHGEMDAINNLATVAESEGISVYQFCLERQLELYTTAEPCPMCMGCIIFTGFSKVTYGTSLEKLSNFGWNQITIPCNDLADKSWINVEVQSGMLDQLTDELYKNGPSSKVINDKCN